MSEDKTQNFNVSNTGNMAGVNIGSGAQTISGNVTGILNGITEPEKSEIKSVLEELQKAIEKEQELNEENRKEALEYLKNIAESAAKPEPETSTIKMATSALKGALIGLPAAAELVVIAQAAIPKILQYFGI